MNNQHHACLVRQSVISLEQALALSGGLGKSEELKKIIYPTIGVGEVRSITEEANRRPTEGDSRLLLVSAESITFEAQQALLKILEEPPASVRFLFVLPVSLTLLPTLLSRFFDLSDKNESVYNEGVAFPAFIKSDYAGRIKEITDRLAKKDTSWVEDMKLGLAAYLATEKRVELSKLKTLQFILRSLGTRGASNKLLLEELALTLAR